jgi:hypothetical protein
MSFKSLECHFVDSIKYAFEYSGPFPTGKLLFKFNFSKEAANHNYSILEQFQFNLSDTLAAQSHTPLQFGSEFKPHDVMRPILENHPLWIFTSRHLLKGATYPLHPMSDMDRYEDISFSSLEEITNLQPSMKS